MGDEDGDFVAQSPPEVDKEQSLIVPSLDRIPTVMLSLDRISDPWFVMLAIM